MCQSKSSRLSYNNGNMTRIHRGNFIGKSIIPLQNVIRKNVTDINDSFSVPAYNGDIICNYSQKGTPSSSIRVLCLQKVMLKRT